MCYESRQHRTTRCRHPCCNKIGGRSERGGGFKNAGNCHVTWGAPEARVGFDPRLARHSCEPLAQAVLQEGDVAQERTAGQGARLLRGEEHKDCDAAVRLQKEVQKKDLKVQKEETAKDTAARTVAESGVMVCRHCSKSFVRQQWFRSHEEGCVEELASHASNRKTAVLRRAVDLAQDQVHSAASLSIGQGNLFRGQENKEMFFPMSITFFPTPPDVPVVKEGWACKGAAGVKGGVFKKSQRDFLLTLFNNNGGPKIRERDAHMRMKQKFMDKDEN